MADTLDLKSGALTGVTVQIRFGALKKMRELSNPQKLVLKCANNRCNELAPTDNIPMSVLVDVIYSLLDRGLVILITCPYDPTSYHLKRTELGDIALKMLVN